MSMNWYNNLSPSTRFVIAETGRVCACLVALVTVEKVVKKTVRVLCGV